jgi:hypothetical protein
LSSASLGTTPARQGRDHTGAVSQRQSATRCAENRQRRPLNPLLRGSARRVSAPRYRLRA